jgi:hypothetical protein
MKNPGGLLVLLITLLSSCTSKQPASMSEPDTTAIERAAVVEVDPVLERFSLPEYLKWKSLMDSLYEKDLTGITDTALINDVESYNPVDMGWSDTYFPDSLHASSTLPAQGKMTYGIQNALDFKPTAWVEGVEGDGLGETIHLHFRRMAAEEPLTRIILYNGFQWSEALFRKNSRIKSLRVSVDGTPTYVFRLQDTMKGQQFAVHIAPNEDRAVMLTLEILDVYPGEIYHDTALTDIQFDGEWKGL